VYGNATAERKEEMLADAVGFGVGELSALVPFCCRA
jgi:hypothetical protein